MKIEVDIDIGKTVKRIAKRIVGVQYRLDLQVLQDSNLFVPEDVGTLRDSGILYTEMGTGQIEWNTPYARAQYYSLPNKSRDKNSRARMKWFEAAKAQYKDEWERLANAEYND